MFVVEAPAFAVDARDVEKPQFVPFNKHTDEPFTEIAAALSVVPLAVVKPNHPEEVPFVNVRACRPDVPVTVRFVSVFARPM